MKKKKKTLIKDAGIILLALAVILTGLPGIGLLAGGELSYEAYAAETDNRLFETEDRMAVFLEDGFDPEVHDGNYYYDMSTGKVAYCLTKGAPAPRDYMTYAKYTPTEQETFILSMVMTMGYPSTTKISGGTELGPQAARSATQMALWALLGQVNSTNIRPAMPGNAYSEACYEAFLHIVNTVRGRLDNGSWETWDPYENSSVNVPENKKAQAYNSSYVRYGPFSVTKGTRVEVTAMNVPSGSYLGRADGSRIASSPITYVPISDTEAVWLYVPANENIASGIRVGIDADAVSDYKIPITFFSLTLSHQGNQPQSLGTYYDNDPGKEMNGTFTALAYAGDVSVNKTDSRTGAALPGCAFRIDEWSAGSSSWHSYGALSYNAGTSRYENSSPLIESEDNEGRFRIVETANPDAYADPSWSREFNIKSGGSFAYSATNIEYRHNPVEIAKTDSKTGDALAGVAWSIEEWNGTSYGAPQGRNAGVSLAWDAASKTYKTMKGGAAADLWESPANAGKFRITEISNPSDKGNRNNYWDPAYDKGANRVREITLTPTNGSATSGTTGTKLTYGASNLPLRRGKIEVSKTDDGSVSGLKHAWNGNGLAGAEFKVQEYRNTDGAWVDTSYKMTWTGNASRTYLSDLLWETPTNDARFRIVETKAPYSYIGVGNPGTLWSREFTLTNAGTTFFVGDGGKLTQNAPNKPTYVDISLSKLDKDTNAALPQGDATLAGAQYSIYAAERITHPDGTVYAKDLRLDTQTTDESGKLTFAKLFPAKYYVKEVSSDGTPSASEGYLTDTAVCNIDATQGSPATGNLARNARSMEQAKKQAFELIKIGTETGKTETDLLEAGFSVYLASELSEVKSGKLKPAGAAWAASDFAGYDFAGETRAKIDGTVTPELFTDERGHLASPEYPFGTYVVTESTVPEGYEKINPFVVTVADDSRTPQPWRIFEDKLIEFHIKIVKKDAETDRVVLGKSAAYRIYDMNKEEYIRMRNLYLGGGGPAWVGTEENPFRTDDTGTLITPEKLKYGSYRIDEVSAPEGYVLAGHEGNAKPGYDEIGLAIPDPSPPVYLEFNENTPAYLPDMDLDILEATQRNEQQKGKISIEKTGERPAEPYRDENGDMIFPYEKGPLENVVFEIIAKEDVLSQDGSGDVLCEAGDTYVTLATDGDGRAWAELPIGEWILHEKIAPEGYLRSEDEEFSVEATDEEKAFSFFAFDPYNVRQKLNIEIEKTEEYTGTPLAGAQFTLYKAEEPDEGIDDPDEKDNADTEKDTGIFAAIKRLLGLAETESAEESSRGEALRTAVTGEDGKALFADLPPGTYIVRETKAPKGFKIDETWEPEIALAYDGHAEETLTFSETCEDEVFGSVEIAKTGELPREPYRDKDGNLLFPHEDGPLAGAVFEVIRTAGSAPAKDEDKDEPKDGTNDEPMDDPADEPEESTDEPAEEPSDEPTGEPEYEILDRVTTDENGYAKSKDLPPGDYILREAITPEGYLTAEDRFFAIEPRGADQEENFFAFDITDVRQKLNIEIEKTEEYTGTPLAGAQFTLYEIQTQSEEETPAANAPSETVPGEIVRTLATGEDGKASFEDLPPGTYTVRETKAPDGYEINAAFAPTIDLAYDGSDAEFLIFTAVCTDKLKLISCEVDKDTIRRTSAAYRSLPDHEGIDNVGKERYRYDIDYRSTSSVFAEEFTVDDPLENVAAEQIRIEELWTAITYGDFDGKFNVWYKTNKTDERTAYSTASAMSTNPENPANPEMKAAYPNTGFKLWEEGLSSTERHRLSVEELNLGEGEYITALRFEHGGVNVGFTTKNYADRSLNGEHRDKTKGEIDLLSENADKIVSANPAVPPAKGDGEDESSYGKSSARIPVPGYEPPEYPGAKTYTGGITGDIVDWTPDESTSFYVAGAAEAENLAPVSYLVSAIREMSDEDIVSSATARIAKDFALRDADADAVVTKELETFTYETEDAPPKIESTFFDNIPERLGGIVKTGDDTLLLLWIALCAASAIAMTSLLLARGRREAARLPVFGERGSRRRRGA